MPELDDHQLLAEFARNDSEEAFAALVRRYVNLVYSTALRSVDDPHAAQEISQAVFIILARKASGFSSKIILSGWLYQVTRLTAANYRRGEIRRQKREQEAYMQSALNEPEENVWPQVTWLLDDEVAKLGERDRNAIVLRFFENKSLGEVGHALGASEDAAKMRVNRALEKLRKAFTKRGVTLTTAAIAGAISANSVHAAPAGLAMTISVTAQGTILSATLTALINTTMKTMTWMKIKFTAGICAAVLVTGGVVTVAISQTTTTSGDDWTPQELAKESQATYAALSSYSDSGTVITEGVGTTLTTAFHIRLQRPNFYRIDWSQTGAFPSEGIVWADGTGNFMVMGSGGVMRKVENKKDAETALASATGVSGDASATIPGTFFSQNWGDVLKGPIANNTKLKKEADATIGGVECHVFSSVVGPKKMRDNMGSTGTTTTTLWIGKQDHLIHQTRAVTENAVITPPHETDEELRKILEQEGAKDITPEAIAAMRSMVSNSMKMAQAVMGKNPKFTFTQTHENIQLNQKFTPADFAR